MKKAAILLVLISAGYGAAAQEQIPINNANFANPETATWTSGGITGWTASIPADVGVQNTSYYTFLPSAPVGDQIGYINSYGSPVSISQTLSATLQPFSIYNLSLDVGARTDGYDPGVDYSVSLYAGGNLLTSVTPVSPSIGGWTTLDAAYTSGAVTPGENLEIVISSSAGSAYSVDQLDFADVQLTDPPVPDAGNVTWLAGLALLGFARFVRVGKVSTK